MVPDGPCSYQYVTSSSMASFSLKQDLEQDFYNDMTFKL